MIKDFDTLKKQLKELVNLINSFKSEAVQLRLIELLFREKEEEYSIPIKDTDISAKTENPKRRKKRKRQKNNGTITKKPSSPKGRLGPTKTLEQLINENFFKTKKTIGDIVQHCNDHMAVTLKSTDLSGSLMKMIRDKKLKRAKNKETKQYEYINA